VVGAVDVLERPHEPVQRCTRMYGVDACALCIENSEFEQIGVCIGVLMHIDAPRTDFRIYSYISYMHYSVFILDSIQGPKITKALMRKKILRDRAWETENRNAGTLDFLIYRLQ
jgi:hypothetical protein